MINEPKKIASFCKLLYELLDIRRHTNDHKLINTADFNLLRHSAELMQLSIMAIQGKLKVSPGDLENNTNLPNDTFGNICDVWLKSFKLVVGNGEQRTEAINILMDDLDLYLEAVLLTLKDIGFDVENLKEEVSWLQKRLQKLEGGQ